jgi:hypothetical protein
VTKWASGRWLSLRNVTTNSDADTNYTMRQPAWNSDAATLHHDQDSDRHSQNEQQFGRWQLLRMFAKMLEFLDHFRSLWSFFGLLRLIAH